MRARIIEKGPWNGGSVKLQTPVSLSASENLTYDKQAWQCHLGFLLRGGGRSPKTTSPPHKVFASLRFSKNNIKNNGNNSLLLQKQRPIVFPPNFF